MEEQEIQDRLYEKIYEFDAEITERNKANSMNSDGSQQEATVLESVEYYQSLKLPNKHGDAINFDGVYVVCEKTGSDIEYRIYLSDSKNLVAKAIKGEDGKFNIEYLNNSIKAMAKETTLEELTEGEEKYTAEFVEQIDLEENYISEGDLEEVKEVAEESESADEVTAKVKLGIVPGTTRNFKDTEKEDFPEFSGKKVQFGYSKKEHAYVVYDVDKADIIMKADMNEKGTTITKVERDGTVSQQVHDVVLSSTANRNNPRKITMRMDMYGNLVLSETYKNRDDGTMIANDMNIEGEAHEDAQVSYALNHLENIQALGETADERETYGISRVNKNRINNVFDQQDFDDFFKRFQEIVGPCPKEYAEDLLKNAEGQTIGEKLKSAVEMHREKDKQLGEERRARIEADKEGRAPGEGAKDPRRE